MSGRGGMPLCFVFSKALYTMCRRAGAALMGKRQNHTVCGSATWCLSKDDSESLLGQDCQLEYLHVDCWGLWSKTEGNVSCMTFYEPVREVICPNLNYTISLFKNYRRLNDLNNTKLSFWKTRDFVKSWEYLKKECQWGCILMCLRKSLLLDFLTLEAPCNPSSKLLPISHLLA